VMLEQVCHDEASAVECRALADEVEQALKAHAIVNPNGYGNIYAYEVDAYGNFYCIDDGNVPSLLSLPYIGAVHQPKKDDNKADAKLYWDTYLNTRRFVLSKNDPYYCKGTAGEGPGGPHEGMGMIWPLGLIVEALTSTDDHEIRRCLKTLQNTHAGTGFMHESFDENNPNKYTRKWFAWANTIFGELILKVYKDNPKLLS
jgi:uncharacterized protein